MVFREASIDFLFSMLPSKRATKQQKCFSLNKKNNLNSECEKYVLVAKKLALRNFELLGSSIFNLLYLTHFNPFLSLKLNIYILAFLSQFIQLINDYLVYFLRLKSWMSWINLKLNWKKYLETSKKGILGCKLLCRYNSMQYHFNAIFVPIFSIASSD